MFNRSVVLYLNDIKDCIRNIERYTKSFTYNRFVKNQKTIDAVIRNLEIIGEAARNVPRDLQKENPQIPWRQMISMRNKVSHEYFGVDYEILWQTIKEDIPQLKRKIKKISLQKK